VSRSKVKKWAGRIGLGVAIWTVVGVLFGSPYALGDGAHESFWGVVINWWLWGMTLPVMQAFDRRLPYETKQPVKLIGSHVAFAVAVVALYVLFASNLEYALGLNAWSPWSNPLGLLNWSLWALMVYALLMGGILVRKFYWRYVEDEIRLERLERGFAEAKLTAIRAQLDPHFLFNTLNGISTQVERDPKSARKMVEDLAELLRISLDSENRKDVSLAEEIGFLQRYIDIQKMRFADRLKVEIAVTPDALSARVPSLILQPLVENAISHGISGRIDGGHVRVVGRRVGDKVELCVEDDGIGLPAQWSLATSRGLGLSATHARVLNFGASGEARMSVEAIATGGTQVSIVLPFHTGGKDRHAAAVA
jgi:signal transduction histidine kinase